MSKIWVNQLIAGTKVWSEMPASRRKEAKGILLNKFLEGEITAEQYETITGETAPEKEETANE
ncbi:MAG: XkdX family protein [Eubacterium sp.]|nr:XkdX family protein [Eubacterium sp.]